MVKLKPVVVGITAIGLASGSAVLPDKRAEMDKMDQMKAMDKMNNEMAKRSDMNNMNQMAQQAETANMNMNMNAVEQMKRDIMSKMDQLNQMESMTAEQKMHEMNELMAEMSQQMTKRAEMDQAARMERLKEVAQMIELTATAEQREQATSTKVYYCQHVNFEGICTWETIPLGPCVNVIPSLRNEISSLANAYPGRTGCRWYTDLDCTGSYLNSDFDRDLYQGGTGPFNDKLESLRCLPRRGPDPGKCDWD
ncbi:hypothetical protein QBC44DRAFT_319725 [Cladorrhinum sp. PSN332]|nr:hypothetical protein QBC44DRAFT_319725 [Cladorrhinum sp. PSN332]